MSVVVAFKMLGCLSCHSSHLYSMIIYVYNETHCTLLKALQICNGMTMFSVHILNEFNVFFIADHSCNTAGCNSVLVLDGNMKNAR